MLCALMAVSLSFATTEHSRYRATMRHSAQARLLSEEAEGDDAAANPDDWRDPGPGPDPEPEPDCDPETTGFCETNDANGDRWFKCNSNFVPSVERCVANALKLANPCLNTPANGNCKVLLLRTDNKKNSFKVSSLLRLPANFYLTGDTGGVDCDVIAGNDCTKKEGLLKTEVAGTSTEDGCSLPFSRSGFVLSDNLFIGNFVYVGRDTSRWPTAGDTACGGGVFETPGCADPYCNTPQEIKGNHANGQFNADGVKNVQVKNVRIGSIDAVCDTFGFGAPQLAVWFAPNRLGRPGCSDVIVDNVYMHKSYENGVNIHGAHSGIVVENCDFACQGDDNIAIWSYPGTNNVDRNILIQKNILSQEGTTSPQVGFWGSCIGEYGGARLGTKNFPEGNQGLANTISRNKCLVDYNTDNKKEVVKFSQFFSDAKGDDGKGGQYWRMFSDQSHIFVLSDYNDGSGDGNRFLGSTCEGAILERGPVMEREEFPLTFPISAHINGCHDISGWNDCPEAAYIPQGCYNNFKGPRPQYLKDGPWGPAWYCGNKNNIVLPKVDGTDLENSCIVKGCNTNQVVFNNDIGAWACQNAGTSAPQADGFLYSYRCYIPAGSTDCKVKFKGGPKTGYYYCEGKEGAVGNPNAQLAACWAPTDCPPGDDQLGYIENYLAPGLRHPFTGWVCIANDGSPRPSLAEWVKPERETDFVEGVENTIFESLEEYYAAFPEDLPQGGETILIEEEN